MALIAERHWVMASDPIVVLPNPMVVSASSACYCKFGV
jgi:hypothetical protein